MKTNTTFKIKNDTYLILPDNTLVSILFVGEVPVYWLTDDKAILVDDPKTIYGGCPHRFGIKID